MNYSRNNVFSPLHPFVEIAMMFEIFKEKG